jgi:hypothetical protein
MWKSESHTKFHGGGKEREYGNGSIGKSCNGAAYDALPLSNRAQRREGFRSIHDWIRQHQTVRYAARSWRFQFQATSNIVPPHVLRLHGYTHAKHRLAWYVKRVAYRITKCNEPHEMKKLMTSLLLGR